MKKVEQLSLPDGKEPYWTWLDSLEIRVMDFGLGFRVYFGELNDIIILLVPGGDKRTQDKDIELA